jgi:DNA adenine methylase
MKSPIKWLGAKHYISERLRPLINEINPQVVIEPFCGSLAFSLHHEFPRVFANDFNPQLVNFYNQLRDGLSYYVCDYENNKNFYYDLRDKYNENNKNGLMNTPASAKKFYYLNKQGFKGLMRLNLSGEFNVPFGNYKKLKPPKLFNEFKLLTSQWDFTYGCFSKVDFSRGDLLFIDPPYYLNFVNYSKDGFNLDDQIALLDKIVDADKPTIYFNSASIKIARECLARGFSVYKVLAPRFMNTHTDSPNQVNELIAFRGFGTDRKFASLVEGIKLWRINDK